MSNSVLDDVYVALRNLFKAKLVSSDTRERVVRAVKEINKEALRQTVRENLDVPRDKSSDAA